MEAKGIRQIAYLINQQSWKPGKNTLSKRHKPAWQNEYAYQTNIAIMKMMKT